MLSTFYSTLSREVDFGSVYSMNIQQYVIIAILKTFLRIVGTK